MISGFFNRELSDRQTLEITDANIVSNIKLRKPQPKVIHCRRGDTIDTSYSFTIKITVPNDGLVDFGYIESEMGIFLTEKFNELVKTHWSDKEPEL